MSRRAPSARIRRTTRSPSCRPSFTACGGQLRIRPVLVRVGLDEARDLRQPPLCHRLLVHPQPERVLVEDLVVDERVDEPCPFLALRRAAGSRDERLPHDVEAGRRNDDAGPLAEPRVRARARRPRTAPPRSAPCGAPGRVSHFTAARARTRSATSRRAPGSPAARTGTSSRCCSTTRRAARWPASCGSVDARHRAEVLLAPVQVQRVDPDPHRGTRGCCSGRPASRARARSRTRARPG